LDHASDADKSVIVVGMAKERCSAWLVLVHALGSVYATDWVVVAKK
jgi:hypothetical protein